MRATSAARRHLVAGLAAVALLLVIALAQVVAVQRR